MIKTVSCFFSFFFHLPIIYLSLVISFFFFSFFFFSSSFYLFKLSNYVMLLLSLLQLCLLILPFQAFLRNQVGESSKQGIRVAWSTLIHQVKWWIGRFGGAYKTQETPEMELVVSVAQGKNETFHSVNISARPLSITFFYRTKHLQNSLCKFFS